MNNADNTENKLLYFDMILLAVFTLAAAITIIYVLTQVLGVKGLGGKLYFLLSCIACITTASFVISSVEVIRHLKTNSHDVYREELDKIAIMRKHKKFFGVVFDVFFILVLCLSILLITMLITKRISPVSDAVGYTVNKLMLCAVILTGTAYLYFMTKTSYTEFEKMQNNKCLYSTISDTSNSK